MVTLLEETSIPAALLANVFGMVVVDFYPSVVRDTQDGWNGTYSNHVQSVFLRLQETSLFESRTLEGRRQWFIIIRAADNLGCLPHKLSKRHVILIGLRHRFSDCNCRKQAVLRTSLGDGPWAASRAAFSSASRVSLKNFFSFSGMCV